MRQPQLVIIFRIKTYSSQNNIFSISSYTFLFRQKGIRWGEGGFSITPPDKGIPKDVNCENLEVGIPAKARIN